VKVAIATVQVPFIRGGADNLTSGLREALVEHGVEVEVVTLPFRFHPPDEVLRSMHAWRQEDFTHLNGIAVDRVICLTFPSFYLHHPHKVAWLLHQHRAVYELWDTPYAQELRRSNQGQELRRQIMAQDTRHLRSCRKVFTIAREVSRRMRRFNAVRSTPLYHPPRFADRFYNAGAEPFVFFPSRLELLKRQDLLVRAMQYVKAPVAALIAGEGGWRPSLERLIGELGLQHRVQLMGRISHDELLACYARCRGVFFGPYREDYGYVTLETMLAAKPVITCEDSGGALEFVRHGQTGLVTAPDPRAIAEAIDELHFHPRSAEQMGRAGLERYRKMNISWHQVVEGLLA
jgi:glycosyltransferase involved in cell wall biosynthesis